MAVSQLMKLLPAGGNWGLELRSLHLVTGVLHLVYHCTAQVSDF